MTTGTYPILTGEVHPHAHHAVQGVVTDSRQVFFFTNATVFDAIPTGGHLGNGTGADNARTLSACSAVRKGL